MDIVINMLDIICILIVIFSIAVYIYMTIIYNAGGKIKDYLPWLIQLIVIYVYSMIIVYMHTTFKG